MNYKWFSSLSFDCICLYIGICMYVCMCVYRYIDTQYTYYIYYKIFKYVPLPPTHTMSCPNLVLMISHLDFPNILLIRGWQLLRLCLLPLSLLSLLIISITPLLLETFLMKPDAIIKTLSKQHSIQTLLELKSTW